MNITMQNTFAQGIIVGFRKDRTKQRQPRKALHRSRSSWRRMGTDKRLVLFSFF